MKEPTEADYDRIRANIRERMIKDGWDGVSNLAKPDNRPLFIQWFTAPRSKYDRSDPVAGVGVMLLGISMIIFGRHEVAALILGGWALWYGLSCLLGPILVIYGHERLGFLVYTSTLWMPMLLGVTWLIAKLIMP